MLNITYKSAARTDLFSKLIFQDLPLDDPKQRQPNIKKADELLNHWKPAIQLEEGLKKTIQYFEDEIRLVK